MVLDLRINPKNVFWRSFSCIFFYGGIHTGIIPGAAEWELFVVLKRELVHFCMVLDLCINPKSQFWHTFSVFFVVLRSCE